MIELAKNIEFLLLENDCVIVPGLGGFIAHYQPARYEAAEQRFYPPVRTIGFNPQLLLNDGLLAQLYMQKFHTDFPDATYRIRHAVEALKDALYEEGRVQIPGVGELCFNMRHAYEFHPLGEGTCSPSLYGLDSFPLRPLGRKLQPEVFPASAMSGESDTPVRRQLIGRRWASRIAATAAAVALFFLLSTPVENTYVDNGNYASLGTGGLFDAIRSQSLVAHVMQPTDQTKKSSSTTSTKKEQRAAKKAEKQAQKAEKKAQKEEKKNNNNQQTSGQQPNQQQGQQNQQQPANNQGQQQGQQNQQTSGQQPNQQQGQQNQQQPANNQGQQQGQQGQQQPANNQGQQQGQQVQKPATNTTTGAPASFKNETSNSVASYFLIVASLLTKSDALKEVEALVKKGFTDAQVIESNGKYRVAVSGYDNKTTANKKLKELQSNASYKDAWLYNK